MKIRLTEEVARIGKPPIRSGEVLTVLEGERMGLFIDDKPGFLSVLVDGEPFQVYFLEWEYAGYFSVWLLTALVLLAILAQIL